VIAAQRCLHDSAKAIIDKSVGFPIACLSVAKIRTLLKWKLNGQTPKGRKDALVNQFNSLAEPAVPVWTAEQENRYFHLKNEDISIQETALGCACEAMVEGVVANIDHISDDAFEKLKHVMNQRMLKRTSGEEQPFSVNDSGSSKDSDSNSNNN